MRNTKFTLRQQKVNNIVPSIKYRNRVQLPEQQEAPGLKAQVLRGRIRNGPAGNTRAEGRRSQDCPANTERGTAQQTSSLQSRINAEMLDSL